MGQVTITQIPQLNSIVVRQKGVRFFVAAIDSFIIDKMGLLVLIEELVEMGFIDKVDLQDLVEIQTRKELKLENKKNRSDAD